MTGEFIAFFILSLFSIGGAVFMINLTRVMHMAVALSFTFLSIAGIFFLLNAEFIAVVQILIYTGAVTILMIFGIMLTRHRQEISQIVPTHGAWSFISVIAFLGIVIWSIYQVPMGESGEQVANYDVSILGESIFTHYVIPFELTSVILLVALVGAVVLAKKEEED